MPTLATVRDGEKAADVPPLDDYGGMLAATALLREPRLARSYVYTVYYGPTAVADLISDLDLARATAYDDVEALESMGVLVRNDDTRPHELRGRAFAFSDADSVVVTPTMLHAVALTEIDDDAEFFWERYGISRLARAVRVAGEYHAGQLTQRMAADELDVSPAEGMAILYALRPVLFAGKRYDPYFERLFPDIASEIDSEGISGANELTGTESEGLLMPDEER
jgi:hypothetical protein